MSEMNGECIRMVSAGGIAAEHPEVEYYPVLVGPTTGSEYNTLKAALIPIACWRVDDIRFAGDTSFINPGIQAELNALQALRDQYPHAPLSIFGHADALGPAKPKRYKLVIQPTDSIWPVKLAENCTGNANRYKELEPYNPALMKGPGQWRDLWAGDEIHLPPEWSEAEIQRARDRGYTIVEESPVGAPPADHEADSKQLSGRRAAAVYALLTRNTAIWEHLYHSPVGDDSWGTAAIQTMQSKTGLPAGTPFTVLCKAYMDQLCTMRDPAGQPIALELNASHDFLARGADWGGKGDYQGCGEFNPVVIDGQNNQSAVTPTENRTAQNAPNRRVMALLFRPGSRVDPNLWPCPRWNEDVAGCKQRFWSDSEKRFNTHLPNEQREYANSKDTFACRFYDRLLEKSPCERSMPIKYVFRFGFSNRLCETRMSDIFLHIESKEGTYRRVFAMNEGILVGRLRIFEFREALAGVAYRAFLVCGERKMMLIENTFIDRIVTAGDPCRSLTHRHQKG